jgi:TldD protein
VTDAALGRAAENGATHAAVRLMHARHVRTTTVDGVAHQSMDTTDIGMGVRVRVGGSEGVAWTDEMTVDGAARVAAEAVALARAATVLGPAGPEPVAAPVQREVTWHDGSRIDPCAVTAAERLGLLRRWSAALLACPPVDQVVATVAAAREETCYADLAGTWIRQTRARVHPFVIVAGSRDTGIRRTLRSLGPPTGRGWEYLLGDGWDWDVELAALPAHLEEKLAAPAVEDGPADLVIAPSQLWMPIHETVGHATELDRALGHEASYAGTTFLGPGDVGAFRLGSEQMTIVADRTRPAGLATVGYDDEGVASGSWTLVHEGVLHAFQDDRATAAAVGATRSRGCAYAASPRDRPLSRMPNVSLCPADDGPTTEELIADVTDGYYLEGGDSFSIDDRRTAFQFSVQRAFRIRRGRLAGQVAGLAYRSATVPFWSALAAVGGPVTVTTFGADMCGKGQPLQIAGASHAAPAALFRQIPVVGTDAVHR